MAGVASHLFRRTVSQAFGTRRAFSVSAAVLRINKLSPSATEAIRDVKSGSTMLVGGFGFSGVPSTLINAIAQSEDIRQLTVVSNNAGMPGVGLGTLIVHVFQGHVSGWSLIADVSAGKLLETKQIGKMIASYIGDNKVLESMYLTGALELELIPQGTMVEKCAAGAAGVPAFYTPTAFGTVGEHAHGRLTCQLVMDNSLHMHLVQTGDLAVRYNQDGTVAAMSQPRETRQFGGKDYVLESSISGDVALVKVHKADRLGNCTFRKAQNNFNESMGKNARLTIVEADEIVEVGELQPEHIHLQSIYVDRVIQSTEPKKIERLVLAKSADDLVKGKLL